MTRYLVDVPDHRAQAFEVHLMHDGWADQITPVRPHPVLDLPVDPEYLPEGVRTIRDYLIRLLLDVWKDGEGFDGKRPFGNSGWDSDLLVPLVRAGLIEGTLDEDGYLETLDDKAGEELIAATIKYLGRTGER